MDLQNSFTVDSDVETAWNTLLDVEAIAPCMPGATLESVDGDSFTGNVKVKLGPVSLTYGGVATFVSKDPVAHKAVIEGTGKESRGTGTAKAMVTVDFTPETPTTTRVDVTTELTITGKAAQFGRGVMQDVAGRLVNQFATNLGTVIASRTAASVVDGRTEGTTEGTTEGATEGAPGGVQAAAPAVPAPVPPMQSAEALDLGSVAMGPVLKRVLPVVIGVVVIVGIAWFIFS